MTGRLKSKVAIITGTGSGVRRAATHAFAREGVKVVGCGINVERAEEPEELAACALYLASDESGYVTKAQFNIDGGYTPV